jgi:hypothetical protein
MCCMRRLLLLFVLHTTQVQAQDLAVPVTPPQAWQHLVARTAHYNLLTDTCGWPGGAMRAQWLRPDRTIEWGCWGYNETGVQIQWSTGQQIWVPWTDLGLGAEHHRTDYQTLHQRVAQLKGRQ